MIIPLWFWGNNYPCGNTSTGCLFYDNDKELYIYSLPRLSGIFAGTAIPTLDAGVAGTLTFNGLFIAYKRYSRAMVFSNSNWSLGPSLATNPWCIAGAVNSSAVNVSNDVAFYKYGMYIGTHSLHYGDSGIYPSSISVTINHPANYYTRTLGVRAPLGKYENGIDNFYVGNQYRYLSLRKSGVTTETQRMFINNYSTDVLNGEFYFQMDTSFVYYPQFNYSHLIEYLWYDGSNWIISKELGVKDIDLGYWEASDEKNFNLQYSGSDIEVDTIYSYFSPDYFLSLSGANVDGNLLVKSGGFLL